jgi:glycosyltransferase involved in cell wall biosynthesis
MALNAIVVSPAPPGHGGLGRAAEAAAEGLRSHGVDVAYVALPRHPTPVQRACQRRPLRRWSWVGRWADRAVMRRRIPEGWSFAYAVPGFLPTRGVRILHQATFHPETVQEQVAAARERAGGGRTFMTVREARLLSAELAAADLIRTESRAVTDDLLARGVAGERIVLASPGVDLDLFRPTPRERTEGIVVAFVGTLSLWKGVDILVALERNLRGLAEVHVVGGPVDSWSRRLVRDAQFRYRRSVPELMADADFLVLPSASDGFGYVVLEAMAAGAVPIVTPAVGAAELVRAVDPSLVVAEREFPERAPDLIRSLSRRTLAIRAREVARDYERAARAEEAAAQLLIGLASAAGLPVPTPSSTSAKSPAPP